jgi:hypothetical protein
VKLQKQNFRLQKATTQHRGFFLTTILKNIQKPQKFSLMPDNHFLNLTSVKPDKINTRRPA